MRLIFAGLSLLMLLFIAVQYNDPDGPMWMVMYLVPAVCAALVAWRPGFFQKPLTATGLLICVLAGLGCMIYYWPEVPGWWLKSVWWEEESAREGMGVMVGFAVLALTWLFSRQGLRRQVASG